MKKIVSLLSAVAMAASLLTSFVFTTEAAVEKPTFSLKFAGYTTAGTSTVSYFPAVEVWVELPFDLVPYSVEYADWENTFEDVYAGKMVQTMGCDLDLGNGFANYVPGKSVANTAEVAKCIISKNAATSKIQLTADAGSGTLDTYYAGKTPVKLGTVVYRTTDPNATNTVSLTTGTVTVTDVASDGTAKPSMYPFSEGKTAVGPALTIPSYNEWSTPAATATPTPTPVVTPEPTPTVEPTPEVTPEPTEGKGTITTEDAADAAAWAWEEFTGVAGNAVKVSINANGSAYYKTFKLGALVENTGETRVGVIIQYNPQNFNDVSVTGVELVTAE